MPRNTSHAALAARLLACVPLLALMVAIPARAQNAQPAQDARPSPTAASSAPAAAAELPTIRVRAGIHPTYARLVFDWDRVVPYRIERQGQSVTVRFAEPARADLAPALRINPPRLSGLSQVAAEPGLTVSFTVPADARVRDFRSGPRLVIDVSGPDTPSADQAAQQPAAPTGQPAGQAQSPAADPRAAAEGPPLFRIPGRGSGAPGAQEQAAQRPEPQPDQPQPRPQPEPQPEPAQTGSAPADPAPAAQATAGPEPAVPSRLIETAPPTPAGTPSGQPAPDARPAPAGAASEAPGRDTAAPAALPADGVRITYDPGGPRAAVVFERAGWLYVLFDRAVDRVPDGADLGGFEGTVEPVEMEEGGGFRIALPAFLLPSVERDGTAWTIALTRTRVGSTDPLAIRSEPDFALGARLVVEAPEAEEVLRFTDPVVGDTLLLVPLPEAGKGNPTPRRYREAELMASAQGLVVRPIHGELQVRAVRDGIDLTVPGGLRLSPQEDRQVSAPRPAAAPERLFDYGNWGSVTNRDFVPRRQALWQAVADAPEEDRNRARLDLARFYAANGFGPEALSVLRLVQEDQPDVDRRPEFLSVRGVALALNRNWDGALADLSRPSVQVEPDAQLWRALAAAAKGEHALAHRLFTEQADRLQSFKEPHFTRMAVAAVDSALAEGDVETAGRWMEKLLRRDADEGPLATHVLYRHGLVLDAQGQADKAEAVFADLSVSHDRLHRTLATRDLIELRLREGKITAGQAAEEYEKLRFAWRGDQLELDILKRLGEVHAQAQNYAQAFDTMRRTISLFPKAPEARTIADRMTEIFTTLFIDDGAAHLSPLEALSLYEQYRELTPPGDQGDRIIRRLAERLVEIDLLDRAAQLRDRQVQFRLAGEEKARVGARLAAIRLLDNRPEDALTALDKSNAPDLSAELQEERRLLRARAMFQTGKGQEAVSLLAQDQSRPANLLRIDIAWRDKQWAAAARALDEVIGPPPVAGAPVSQEVARLVVNRAVALSLARDDAGLAQLRDRFGPAMERTSDAQIFAVLTRPSETVGLVDLNTIQARMAEIDMFKSFLDRYRAREQATEEPAPQAAAPAGPEQQAAAPAAN